mgnify:CR=1 FL=1
MPFFGFLAKIISIFFDQGVDISPLGFINSLFVPGENRDVPRDAPPGA